MSRVIKSNHCVEAHPCRLEPVDVDAFFVNNQEEGEESISPSEADSETAAALEEILETLLPPDQKTAEEPDRQLKTDLEDNEKTNDDLADQEPKVPDIDLFKINLDAERIIDQSKQEAGALAQIAREKADNITRAANDEANGIIEKARDNADQIKEKAKLHAEGIIEKAQQQAGEVLAKAKQEAEEIINQARQQAGELKKEAREEGNQTGYQEGLAKAKKEWEQNLATSLQLITEAEEARVQRIISSEAELLKLVSGIAAKIIGAELQSNPEQLLALIREALSRVATANSITVKVNPDDLNMINANLPALQEVFNEPKTIGLKADPNIPKNNCFIETEHGNVDARIKTQLERIMNEILKAGRINEPG